MKKILLLSVFSLFVIGIAKGQENELQADPYDEAVKKMLAVTNVQGQFDAIVPQIFGMFRAQATSVPTEFWDMAEAKMNKELLDGILQIYIPLYKEYFTLEEIQELTRFYESPLGQKMSKTLPEMTVKAMQSSQQLTMRIAQELVAELKEKGYMPVSE